MSNNQQSLVFGKHDAYVWFEWSWSEVGKKRSLLSVRPLPPSNMCLNRRHYPQIDMTCVEARGERKGGHLKENSDGRTRFYEGIFTGNGGFFYLSLFFLSFGEEKRKKGMKRFISARQKLRKSFLRRVSLSLPPSLSLSLSLPPSLSLLEVLGWLQIDSPQEREKTRNRSEEEKRRKNEMGPKNPAVGFSSWVHFLLPLPTPRFSSSFSSLCGFARPWQRLGGRN